MNIFLWTLAIILGIAVLLIIISFVTLMLLAVIDGNSISTAFTDKDDDFILSPTSPIFTSISGES